MKLTIKRKLGLGFGAILFLTTASAVLIYGKISDLAQDQIYLLTNRVPTLAATKDLQRDLNQTGSKSRQVILAGTEATPREAAVKLFEGAWIGVNKDLDRLKELSPHWALQENRNRLADMNKQVLILRELEDAANHHAASGEHDAVIKAGDELSQKAMQTNDAIRATLGDLAASIDKLFEQEKEMLTAEVRALNLTLLMGSLAALSVGIFVAIFLSRNLSDATQAVLVQAEAIAEGDLTGVDLKIRSRDELGDLTTAINKMSGSLRHMILSIRGSAERVAGVSEQLNSTSQHITVNCQETSAQGDVIFKAAQTVSQNLQTVAAGADEMSASIKEIAKNATEAATIATAAVKVAETTTATVSKLGDSSTEIGQVIKVITSIAQQTNLLALNATIEAARAGEAGKGFAVVANEVKELAKETAKATEDISRKIEAIQTDTKAAVDAIGSISGVINQINDISSTIATAVEEQSATTNEMSRNVSEAAQHSGAITSNTTGMTEAAKLGATDTQKASQELVETSAELHRLVEQFKINASGNATGNNAAATQAQSRAARAGIS
jgi:methyl-accepting chemotaxis protein